jgi:hypothetical protein
MVRPPIGRDLTDLEREIAAEVRSIDEPRPGNFAQPRVAAPALSMPDYVEHRDGATEIGKLSAEAIVREYEAAAKDIEAMGTELILRVKECEVMTGGALAAIEEMKETAARYREEAKRIFVQIENCSLLTAEVRQTCIELAEKIAAPTTTKPKKVNPVSPTGNAILNPLTSPDSGA